MAEHPLSKAWRGVGDNPGAIDRAGDNMAAELDRITSAGGPVVADPLFRFETLECERAIEEVIASPVKRLVAEAQRSLGAMVRDAYARGLRDGFAQGAAAAHRAPAEEVRDG